MRMWNVSTRSRHGQFLPGPHPASFGSEDYGRVAGRPQKWLVSCKSDGERRGVVVLRDGIITFDRNMRHAVTGVRWSQACLDCPEMLPIVFDAEVCRNDLGESVIIAFDLYFWKDSFLPAPATARVQSCAKAVDYVRLNGTIEGGVFEIISKPWVYANQLPDVLPRAWWATPMSTPQDGLIFMHADVPATNGNQTEILKWKASHTIDCWYFPEFRHNVGGALWANDKGRPCPLSRICAYRLEGVEDVSSARSVEANVSAWEAFPDHHTKVPAGRLMEFAISVSSQGSETEREVCLKFVRMREDKPYANDVGVIARTITHAASTRPLSELCDMIATGSRRR